MPSANITVIKLIEIQDAIIQDSSKYEDQNMNGVRDEGSLQFYVDSIEENPEICNDPIKKVAFTIYFIPNNQVFKQANKRTAIAISDMILEYENLEIESDTPEFKAFMINAEEGKYTLDEIEDWVSKRVKKLEIA